MKSRPRLAIEIPVVLVAWTLMAPTVATAQSFGITGGASVANVNITEPRQLPAELQWCCSPWDGTRLDAAVGLFGGIELRPGSELTVELLFTNRGFEIGRDKAAPGARLRMSYIEIPVQGHLVANWIRLSGGAAVGFERSTSMRSDDIGHTEDYLDRRSLAKVDVSLVFGAGIYRGRLSLGVRYVHGLRNVLRAAPAGSSLRHKSFMLMLGMRLTGDPCDPLPAASTPHRR